jgi:hypothetical protein
LQAHILVNVISTCINGERRRFGRAKNFDDAFANLNFACAQVAIDSSVWSRAHDARNLDDVFASDVNSIVDDTLNDS